MSNKLAIVLAGGLLGSLLASNVQAFPGSASPQQRGDLHRDAGARLLRAQFPPRPRRLLRAQRGILHLSAGAAAAPGGCAAGVPGWLLSRSGRPLLCAAGVSKRLLPRSIRPMLSILAAVSASGRLAVVGRMEFRCPRGIICRRWAAPGYLHAGVIGLCRI